MQQTAQTEQDQLVLDGRKRLSMTNVESVEGFSEQSLKLIVKGNRVQILGENIKITVFNKASGNLSAEGDFSEIKYNYKKAPLLKRIFK